MKESILHYVWQHRLFSTHSLKTTDGEPIEVLDTGCSNTDAGPDFFNAKVKIGDTVWAGNIEIHASASDWKKHNHSADKAYDSVILHVVKKADADIFRANGLKIPQLELTYPGYIDDNYQELAQQTKWMACGGKVSSIPSVFIEGWKNVLLTERLEQKTESIKLLLKQNSNHWEESFYITLAKNFGFGTNSQPFEALAKSLPLTVLAKHKNNLLQLEALLFGQSGLLPEAANDEYTGLLIREYAFLRSKYVLETRLDSSKWKLLRLRPANFPHVRIAQFAALIHSSSKLFSKILDNAEIGYLHKLFSCEPSAYWKTHYTFSSDKSKEKPKTLGGQAVNTIIINTIIPFLFCYASAKENQELKEKAVNLLEQLPSEKNSIITNWKSFDISCTTAYDSQALIQLRKKYCDEKKCLRCRIGHKVLTIQR